MVSIHVPKWARRRHIGSRRAGEIRSTRLCGRDPTRELSTLATAVHTPMWARLPPRRFDLRAYQDAASKCSRRFRSTRPCGRDFRRIGFPASRRRLRSYVQPRGVRGRFAPRTNVGRVRVPPRHTASRPGEFHVPMWARRPTDWVRIVARDGSIYVPMRVSPRPPRCDAVSCRLRPISLHAPMWARRQFSTLSFVDQIKSAAFFSVPCALARALIRRQQIIQFRMNLFYLFQRIFCWVTFFSERCCC
jgi:hypothetical protein